MATTTPNFSWPVPTSTDLVKDGATAIESLGDAIDASLVDLKGGTTGQVLSKTSATDMDFTWVAQDDSNAIQNAIVDAKGDLIAATAADTPARLAVGTNGQILTADSTAATGIKWATPATTSSGLTYIGQGTFSAATSATLDNCFTSTYRNYLLVFDYTVSADGDVRVTFRTGGTDNTTASYYSEILAAYGSSVIASNSASQTNAKIGGSGSNGGLVNATIYAPQATAISRIESRGHKDTGGSAEVHVYNAGFNATTSFDGIKLSTATGNITGTFRIYGLANS